MQDMLDTGDRVLLIQGLLSSTLNHVLSLVSPRSGDLWKTLLPASIVLPSSPRTLFPPLSPPFLSCFSVCVSHTFIFEAPNHVLSVLIATLQVRVNGEWLG